LPTSQRDVTLDLPANREDIGDRLPPSASNTGHGGPMKKMDTQPCTCLDEAGWEWIPLIKGRNGCGFVRGNKTEWLRGQPIKGHYLTEDA